MAGMIVCTFSGRQTERDILARAFGRGIMKLLRAGRRKIYRSRKGE